MKPQSERDFAALSRNDRALAEIEPILNTSGLVPVEYKVLIKLDPVEEKTTGGIILPEDTSERSQMAQTYATLIAIGGNAFEDWKDPKPKAGDKIVVDKYAGLPPKAGDITDLYRLCQDKDICAIRL